MLNRHLCYSFGRFPFVRERRVNEILWSHPSLTDRVAFLSRLTSVATITLQVLFFSIVYSAVAHFLFLFFSSTVYFIHLFRSLSFQNHINHLYIGFELLG